ncbi:efflux RND transporter permease subunit [Rhizobium cremeum]|uniref:efflux RND transporter permease subunit n=1 Tax=Rhizobium cremeum TaxID=2813827 RepID=UPI001FD1413E|nr:efflux RND transporter permease subunit [Rhizobium cremeum]MCJ7996478.1 efflux RND transporter permease subunit [Rhizobium cremeum]MCJ8001737.1 efflux RND transporter permease subunit [Rhizobium cremeum]
MKSFNLSDWALKHRSLVWYLMIIFMLAGALSFVEIGREEDPSFTIKTMTISAQWPGASVSDTTKQVTERIERKLEELDSLDYTKSITRAGSTLIFVELKPTTKARNVPQIWQKVRNMMADIQGEFPSGVLGPQFNDDFGDVFGNIYAFTADGLSERQLRDYVEEARTRILAVDNIGKVDLVGARDEVIFLEFSTRQLASLGLDQTAVLSTLQAQNATAPSGVIQSGPERISVRVGGQFSSEESLREVNLRVNDRFFRLSDIATIRRGYTDPPSDLFRFNGQPAIGLAIGMKQGANLLEFGEALKAEMHDIEAKLPVGVGVHLVSDQPQVVEEAVSGFTQALFEAVVIVLVVSFVSLGLRAGFVVALSIPLTLAITFLVMSLLEISLQRISLGALIIALGLLVDDAMIAVEMMVARLEIGDPMKKAATYVYTSTAFPMLTGTLVTVAGFIPIGLNSSAAGEFTFTLFVVLAVSLLTSWIVAVLFTPLLGATILSEKLKKHEHKKGFFGRMFEDFLHLSMHWRFTTIGITVAIFGLSIYGMQFVQQQFFPSSDRVELIVDWSLPQNVSITETNAEIERFEKEQLAGNPDVVRYSSYVGQGAVRFVLAFDVQPPDPAFGQTIIITKDLEARDRLKRQFQDYLKKTFPATDAYVKLLDIGPPVGRPVQYRISSEDIETLKLKAQELAGIMARNPHIGDVVYDWMEPARVLRVNVLQDKARLLGVSSKDIATVLNGVVGGTSVTQINDDVYLVDVIARANPQERSSIDTLEDLQLTGSNGTSVPLAAVANFRYETEQPVIWRRDRVPTISVKAGILDAMQPATVVEQLTGDVDEFRKTLPAGFTLEVGGTVESSAESQEPIAAVVPYMLLAMATILMVQLQSFSRLFLVFSVAPLALIGVVAALLPSGAPMGFVAILGVLALIGILIRNSVILVVQIEELRAEGKAPWEAVLEATQHRTRPILLTAAAASLGLIPIAREVFWGPMAYAMMGGIIVGTLLTLIFLPALYVAWFRLTPDTPASPVTAEAE